MLCWKSTVEHTVAFLWVNILRNTLHHAQYPMLLNGNRKTSCFCSLKCKTGECLLFVYSPWAHIWQLEVHYPTPDYMHPSCSLMISKHRTFAPKCLQRHYWSCSSSFCEVSCRNRGIQRGVGYQTKLKPDWPLEYPFLCHSENQSTSMADTVGSSVWNMTPYASPRISPGH